MHVKHVRHLIVRHERERSTVSTCTRCSADTVDKQFWRHREVVVDHVVEQGNVNSTRCNVRDDQKLALVGAKFPDAGLARGWIKVAVHKGNTVTSIA
jgi:hypothetical protein